MTLTNAGSVGIGTTAPEVKLDVVGTAVTDGARRDVIRVYDTTAFGAGIGPGITFLAKINTAGSYDNMGGIVGIKENSTDGETSGALALYTRAHGSSPGEKVRISSIGNVGIGENVFTGPGGYEAYTKLWLTNKVSAGDQALMRINSRSDTNAGIWLHRDTQTKGFYLGQASGASGVLKLTFGTGANEGAALTDAKDGSKGIVVDESGNIGIGTTAPGHKLDVAGAIYSRRYAAAADIDWNNGNTQSLTLTAAPTTLTFANGRDGGKYVLILKQDATGSRTITWPAEARFPGGTALTLTTTANKTDYVGFIYNGADLKYDAVAFMRDL